MERLRALLSAGNKTIRGRGKKKAVIIITPRSNFATNKKEQINKILPGEERGKGAQTYRSTNTFPAEKCDPPRRLTCSPFLTSSWPPTSLLLQR